MSADPSAFAPDQTIPLTAAVWTPPGRGAVAVIRVTGNLPMSDRTSAPFPFHAANGKALADQCVGQIVFGRWMGRDDSSSEDIVLCRTGKSELEIHCHGGRAAIDRILADCERLGCQILSWEQAGQRVQGQLAFDFQRALIHCTTLKTAAIILDQQSTWQSFAGSLVQRALSGDWEALSRDVEAAASWQEFGRHLIEPWRVVLTGRPNVGKSALLNALIGYQRSVVFDQPGTTRDIVTAETAFDGWPVRVIDTAGLRDSATGLEAAGIELAHRELESADLLLQVADSVDEPSMPTSADRRTIRVLNKIDLIAERTSLPSDVIPVSARTGEGIEHLIDVIARHIVPATPALGVLVPVLDTQMQWLQAVRAAIDQRNLCRLTQLAAEAGYA